MIELVPWKVNADIRVSLVPQEEGKLGTLRGTTIAEELIVADLLSGKEKHLQT